MEWNVVGDGDEHEHQGALGYWVCCRSSDVRTRVAFAPVGVDEFQARYFAIFGSMAEARLAVALYEHVPLIDLSIEDIVAQAGFVRRKADATNGHTAYEKQSPPCTLELVFGGGDSLRSEHFVSVSNVQQNQVRWNTVARITDVQPAGSHDVAKGWRPKLDACTPFAADVQVAIAIAEARFQAHGNHKKPLAMGEEEPFVAALLETGRNARPATAKP